MLRKHPGKAIAYIYDLIVTPPKSSDTVDESDKTLLKPEVVRALQFAQNAINSSSKIDIPDIANINNINNSELILDPEEEEEDYEEVTTNRRTEHNGIKK